MNTWVKVTRHGTDRVEHQCEGVVGKNYKTSNAHEIEAHHHYNGSGPTCMNGSTKWPVATIRVAFLEGQEKERDEFIEAFKVFLTRHFNPPVKEGIPLKDLPAWKAGQAAKKR